MTRIRSIVRGVGQRLLRNRRSRPLPRYGKEILSDLTFKIKCLKSNIALITGIIQEVANRRIRSNGVLDYSDYSLELLPQMERALRGMKAQTGSFGPDSKADRRALRERIEVLEADIDTVRAFFNDPENYRMNILPTWRNYLNELEKKAALIVRGRF